MRLARFKHPGSPFSSTPFERPNRSPGETKARPPSVSKSVTAPPAAGKKILVIDDTEMLLIFVEDALATADPTLQIVTAFTGGEGVRRAEVMVPDLVLLDYSLPDLPGDQVCARLLENEATARIPVLMMSGHVPEMLAAAEKYENVVATIAKPFLSDALVALVTQTLAKGPLVASQKRKRPRRQLRLIRSRRARETAENRLRRKRRKRNRRCHSRQRAVLPRSPNRRMSRPR